MIEMDAKTAIRIIDRANTDLLARKDVLLMLTFDIKVMTTTITIPYGPNGMQAGPPISITSVADLKCDLDQPVEIVCDDVDANPFLSFFDVSRKTKFYIPASKFSSAGTVDKDILKRKKTDMMSI